VPTIALTLLCIWLLWPVFFAQQLEGITASFQALALAGQRGAMMRQDLLYPLLGDFLFYSRPGMAALLELIYRLAGNIGDSSFRLVMIGSLAVTIGSCLVIARRLAGVGVWAALLALLIVPGVSQCAFFFNDNLPSAALAIGALAVIALSDALIAYVVAGALLALGMAVRIDAVLLAPMLVGVTLARASRTGDAVQRLAAAALGLTVVIAIERIVLGATPVDALLLARDFVPIQQLRTSVIDAALFFGIAGVPLIGWGMALNLAGTRSLGSAGVRFAAWGLYPAILGLIALRMSSEVRYIFPLFAPVIAVHGGRGLEAWFATLARRTVAGVAMAALLAATLLLPPRVYVFDSPQAMWGRLWMPILWSRWHARVAGNLAVIDGLVGEADRSPRLLVINTHFNDELFFKERVIQAGYAVLEPSTVFPGCTGFSLYGKAGHLVAQVRTDNQYRQVATGRTHYAALMLDTALACPALATFSPAYVTVYGTNNRLFLHETADPALWGNLWHYFRPVSGLSEAFSASSLLSLHPWQAEAALATQPRRLLEAKLRAYPVTFSDLAVLRRAARFYLRRPPSGPEDRPVTFADVQKAFAPRCRRFTPADRLSVTPQCWPGSL
jgi:hypothetical protein